MRYAPELPLPLYTYVPGQTLHPFSDPQGHRLMGLRFADPAIDFDRWFDCAAYCYAIDLFNHGFYWEAHEVWEGLWVGLGRKGTEADFLKGLIKLAAALVKAREGRPEGVRRHARRARELFATVREGRRADQIQLGGLNLDELGALSDDLERRASSSLFADPPLVTGPISNAIANFRLHPRNGPL